MLDLSSDGAMVTAARLPSCDGPMDHCDWKSGLGMGVMCRKYRFSRAYFPDSLETIGLVVGTFPILSKHYVLNLQYLLETTPLLLPSRALIRPSVGGSKQIFSLIYPI